MYKIAVGEHHESTAIKNVAVSWAGIVKQLTKHKVSAEKGGKYIVGGHFKGNTRTGADLIARTLLLLDIDAYDGDIDSLEFELGLWLQCSFVAYSSFSHTSAQPRIRVVIPMSRELHAEEYRTFAEGFCKGSLLPVTVFDACSWKPNQAMFMPQYPEGGACWSMVGEGLPLDIGEIYTTTADSSDDDLSIMVAAVPLDISEVEVDTYLSAYPALDLDYDAWLKVGMALYHQFSGSKLGFTKWVAWSALSAKHDEKTMHSKYKSFGGSAKPVTMASIIHHVKQAGGVVAADSSFYDDLLAEASAIETLTEYTTFKIKVSAMSDNLLPPVHRSGLVSEIADNFGRMHKITKSAFTKELKCSKKHVYDTSNYPDWLKPWVYVENVCAFANSEVPDYQIPRESFNAKYDRKIECISAEKPASNVALVTYQIQTVVDTMFFPRASKFFEYEGKHMMNSYLPKGVSPDKSISEDGQEGVGIFLEHLAFTLEDGGEQELLLNWMAYIYQNPGKRVGWAMLLQGAQGTGKSYFGNVLEYLMGSNVKSLDTQAISGRFTGWATGALLAIVEEIRIAGTNKYEVLDKLKPIISNATIQIEEKGRDHRTVPNFTSYFLLTNHKDAVPLQDGDRRYCALFSRVQSEEQLYAELGGVEGTKAYFDRLFDSTRKNIGAIARFLLDYSIPASFDPTGRAPETSARREMKALSISPDRDILENAIEQFKCEVINDEFVDVTWLNHLAKINGDELPKTRAITAILSELGYSQIHGRRVKISGKGYHYVWLKNIENDNAITKIVKNFHSASDFQ